MRINFQIAGSLQVPDALCPLDGATNQYRLPTGEVLSVHPVIEIASGPDADDHRDLGASEAAALGLFFDIYDRASDLEPAACSLHRAALGRRRARLRDGPPVVQSNPARSNPRSSKRRFPQP